LVNDPKVDVIYVATPHSHHYDCVKLALNAGKHVLCEKPFTVNAAQAKILAALAKEKNRFLLEAVWTRFFPLSKQVRHLISSGALGDVHMVFADLSVDMEKGVKGLKHRMYNPDLAGGSLLDLGTYSLTWVMQTIYDAQKDRGEKPTITGSLVPDPDTGVDETATVVLTWKDGSVSSRFAIPNNSYRNRNIKHDRSTLGRWEVFRFRRSWGQNYRNKSHIDYPARHISPDRIYNSLVCRRQQAREARRRDSRKRNALAG
jgi:predicted dehydrogenase